MIDGLDDLEDNLQELVDNTEQGENEDYTPLNDLFDPGFMREYTDFDTIEEFLEASPWNIETQSGLSSIPDDEADTYVDEHTHFSSSDQMVGKAFEERTSKRFGD